MKKIIFLILISCLVLSCGKKPNAYFPMKVGNSWDFNFTMKNGPNSNNATMNYKITMVTNMSGNEYYKFESSFGSSPENMSHATDYYRESPQGIVIRSSDTTKTDELVVIPADLKVGTEWDANYPTGKRHFKLSAFEDVVIGDKTYKDCLKVDYSDLASGGTSTGNYYFGRGVGFVKIHIESKGPDGSTGTTDATLAKFSE